MTTKKRQNPQRFEAVPGETYENAGGGRFLCTDSWDGNAIMVNVVSGWKCTAHGLVRYEDGTIEWDYSTGGFFTDLETLKHRQRSMMNAMLCCAI